MARKVKDIIPPLTTPFTESGELYKEGLRRLVDFQVESGIHGLFICGTYGSGPVMSVQEHKTVHEVVVDQAGGETGGYARRIQEMALLQPQALRWIWC